MAYVDWIKVEHTTPNKSEVANIAERLNIDPDAVLGKLVRLWIWADQNSENGNLNVTTCGYIDRITYCPGFGDAMIAVGWLATDGGKLTIPNFDSHNSESAKKRAKNVKKQRKHRETRNQNVTDSSPDEGELSVTPSSSSSMSTFTSSSLGGVGGIRPFGSPPRNDEELAADMAVEFHTRIPGTFRPLIPDLAAEFLAKLRWLKANGRDDTEHIWACIRNPKRDASATKSIATMFKFWQFCGIDGDKSNANGKRTRAVTGGDAWGDAERYDGRNVPEFDAATGEIRVPAAAG